MTDQGPIEPPRFRMSREARYIGIALILLALGWVTSLLSAILLPFILGAAIAYFLDPVADRLEARKFSRGIATALILLVFLSGVTLLLLLLLPLLQDQILALVDRIPTIIQAVRAKAEPLLEQVQSRISQENLGKLQTAAGDYVGTAVKWAAEILKKLLSGGVAFFNLLSLIIITPVVAFYMLRDWDIMVAHVNELLPRDFAPKIREQAGLIDETIAGFVRGQSLVCLVLAVWYAGGLMLVGLDFGLLIGIGAGAISFIPYVGAALGFIVGVGLALLQFSDWLPVIMVAAVFIVGQTAESYYLSPKLVGERVGLHPVWLMFALMAGGALFGFTGVLLAVPVAAIIGVLLRFAIQNYRNSDLYHGHEDEDEESENRESGK
ncbi:MAG: AI-2E family transporter [Magnetovibrionaceae bacterium]